jgi:putative ABC transport system substrate-binding protein
MKRLALFLILLAPLAASAQAPGKIASVGVLTAVSASEYSPNLQALRQGLRELGYVEGKSIRIEPRYAEGKPERLAELAVELNRLGVDVLVTAGSHVTRVARGSTRDIPIVMAYSADPVAVGFADSLSRPGGRITGLTTLSSQLGGKRLEILKAVFPGLANVGVIWNPNVPERVLQFKDTQGAAATLRVQVHSFEARRGEEVDSALKAATGKRLDALIVFNDPVMEVKVKRIAEVAAKSRLPTVHQDRRGAAAGGLISFGANIPDLSRRAADYVDRIIRGAKPGNLPIEQPTKFELVVNLKTAKALGITIPHAVLVRADEVIQ